MTNKHVELTAVGAAYDDMRDKDVGPPHPGAVKRAQAELDEARSRAQRWIVGWIGVAMCVAAFGTGVYMIAEERGPVWLGVAVLAGSFVGALVAGNHLPYATAMEFALKWKGKLGV